MRILVVRFKLMGDVILASALCNTLRTSFPDATIDYVTYAPYSDLFANHSAIDNVIGIEKKTRKSPFAYLKCVWSITRDHYDVVIDAQSTVKSNFFALFSPRAEFKVSSSRKRLALGYTHLVNEPETQVDKIQERLRLLEPLTEKYQIHKVEQYNLSITDTEYRNAQAKLAGLGLDTSRPLFAFAVSASERYKKWCRLEMHKLVHHCRDVHKAQILLFSGLPREHGDVELFLSELESQDDVFSGYPIESLRCLPALFSACVLFVGNEGGPRHVAQAVNTPTVSVFSPSACKSEWLPGRGELHQALEWRDVLGNKPDDCDDMEIGDAKYFKLYNSMKAEMVMPLIDRVLELS